MAYFIAKIVLTSFLIVLISEIAKRSSLIGGILASLPLISLLAMIWIYIDTRDIEKISRLSTAIFWLVIPSLVMFITLPVLLKKGINFYISMSMSATLTVLCYYLMLLLIKKMGIEL